jgi:replication factor C subunit 1
LAVIKKHNLRTIDEDEFLNLIGTRVGPSGGGKVDEKMRKKLEKDDELIRQGVKELEKREKIAKNQKGRLVGSKLFCRIL